MNIPDFAFNTMRLLDSRVNKNLEFFLFLLFKADLSSILPIMAY